jgi:Mrp family chromosome partitioning ATPase/capsular polysaccharide biosynthesis protein
MNLRTFAAVMWRRRLLALTVLVLELAAVLIGLSRAQRMYTSVATVAATPQATVPAATDVDELLATLARVASSGPVLADVSSALGGARSPAALAKEVSGSVIDGTSLVQVTVVDRDPRVAALAANAAAQALPERDPSRAYLSLVTTEPATESTSFSSPNVRIVLLAGIALGIALAIAAALVRDRLARTVETAEEIGELTGAGVLGVISRPGDPRSLPAVDGSSPQFEPLRGLRVALEFAGSEQPTRTLVVTGAAPDPWGGWLTVNLAAALADVGHRVLLIDTIRDERRRHPVLDAPELPGFYDMLSGSATLDAVALAGPVDGVTVVPLGNADSAAPSLLEMRVRRLLDDVDEKYDVILVHAAPLTDSDDARIMAIGGGVLLSVPARRIKPRTLARVAAELREIRIRVVGSVLVGTKPATRRGRRWIERHQA